MARNLRGKLKTFRDDWGLGLTLTNREVHVKSLDQLYAQAGAVNVYLTQKVREWAEECGGTTDTAEVKSVSRSIEKLLGSYKTDVSRLLDVSRQRIVFDSIDKLISCFEKIAVDDSVLIVRCKNRLCAKYNAMYSAGYRDVCLNVRFVQGEPVRLGLDCHIVEIQLCLRPIFKLSTMETHKRYVHFRSHRGHAMIYFEQNFNRFISIFKLSTYRWSVCGKQSTDNRIAPLADSPSRHGATPVGRFRPETTSTPHGGRTGAAPLKFLTSTSNENANFESDEDSVPNAHGNRGRRRSSNHGLNMVAMAAANMFNRLTSTGNFPTPAAPSFDRQHRQSISKMELLYVPGRFTDPSYDELLSTMFDNSQATDTFFNLPGIGQGSAHVIRKASSLLHQADHAEYNEAFYRSWFEMLTAFPGNFLDHRMSVVASGLGDANGNSALFTSRPLSAALRFVRWRFALCFAAVAYISVGLMSLDAQLKSMPLPRLVSGEQGGIYSRFRFTAVQTRSGKPATFPGIDSFQVLQGGCPTRSDALNISINGPKMEIVYHKPLAYDGFSIVTSTSHPHDHDPVRFILEGGVDGGGAHDDAPDEEVGSEHAEHGHRREGIRRMEGMGEIGTKWEWVGSSSMAWGRSMSLDEDSSLVDSMNNIPMRRGVEFAISLTVPIWAIHCYIVTSFVTGIGFMIIFVFATLNRIVEAAQAVSALILIAGLCNLCTAILLYHDQYVAIGTYWLIFASVALSYGTAIAMNERLFVPGLTLTGVLLTFLDLIYRFIQAPPDVAWQLFTSDPPVTGLLAFVAGLTAFMLRWRTVSKAELMITSDCAAYEQEWQRVISNEMEDVGRLKGLTSVYKSRPVQLARQYCRKRQFPLSVDYKMFASKETDKDSATHLSDDEDPAGSFAGLSPRSGTTFDIASSSMWVSPESTFTAPAGPSRRPNLRKSMRSFGTGGSQMRIEMKRVANAAIDLSTRVQSLDQLFAQAAGLHPVLQEKVQQWALESKGYFRVAQQEGAVQASQPGTWVPTATTSSSTGETATFVLWEDAVRDSTLRGSIKWGKLKGIPRSIEKLLRSYDADPSKLLDVCRQTIVYDSVKDLCDGLKAIRDDPEVFVVRCKNRLDPDCNSAYSAGYRDVSLNLRIQNNASARIGVDCHVCEVQLMLKSFASIKNAEGHARYISFRNARGE